MISISRKHHAYVKVRGQKQGSKYGAPMILKNISKSGAQLHLVTAYTEFLKGDLIQLEINLDAVNRNHIINAEVVWSKEGALGVSFKSPDSAVFNLADMKQALSKSE